jgi:hypothetical protein
LQHLGRTRRARRILAAHFGIRAPAFVQQTFPARRIAKFSGEPEKQRCASQNEDLSKRQNQQNQQRRVMHELPPVLVGRIETEN